MSFDRYKAINNITGWIAFAIAAATYLLTIEPTTSLWDTGEFISASYKLEVVHSPGAPFFLMLNRLFTMLAPDPTWVPWMVNASSAIASAFTILFLFWTITALCLRILSRNDEELTTGKMIGIIGSGLVGALAYTWSDSFWFSAVEGEVYALSSFFTAIVFWLMLKWERRANQPHSFKWIVLIAYLLGLAIGVHLLGLLVVPALAFIYYFKQYRPTTWGIVLTALIGLAILGIIQIGIIQGLPTLASKFELMFVNSFGLPFWSGFFFFFLVLFGLIIWGLFWSRDNGHVWVHNGLLCFVVILLGYTSNAMVVIRSNADPAIDMGDPEHVFRFISYLKREQYGSTPLLKGPYYNAQVVEYEYDNEYEKGEDEYIELTDNKLIPVYDPADQTIFPRMWSPQAHHVDFYRSWQDLRENEKPAFSDNLGFFFTYQMGHMYWRYFAWNFIGRQNDIQGHGEFNNGNWISGIDFIDETFAGVGEQDNLSYNYATDKARNTFYLLPFLLGILGLIWQLREDEKSFISVLIFFVMTGIAIGVYLNMPPIQPRERDYAFVGSFYVFSIWVGMGVMFIADLIRKKADWKVAGAVATVIGLLIAPINMVADTWDDHDRSDRYTAHDFAINYLQSCPPNAVLFTNGDNDTYPVWYVQEVEGFRDDVRVINLSLLNTSWYVDQMREDFNNSAGLKLSLTPEKILQGNRDYVVYYDNPQLNMDPDRFYDLGQIIDFVASDKPETKVPVQRGKEIHYYPTKKFAIPVDKEKVLANGTVHPDFAEDIVERVEWNVRKNTLMKADLVVLDLIAQNNWERPICFAITTGTDAYINLTEYFQLLGMVYQLVPVKTDRNRDQQAGFVNTEAMYHNVMNEFQWGNLPTEELYIGSVLERQCMNFRNVFARLARALISEGKTDKAIEVLDRAIEVMPEENVPYDIFMLPLAEMYYQAGSPEKGGTLAERLAWLYEDELEYYMSLDGRLQRQVNDEIQRNFYGLNTIQRLAEQAGQTELAEQTQAAVQRIQAQSGPAGPLP